jgi:Tfp pilus assembly protein PilN
VPAGCRVPSRQHSGQADARPARTRATDLIGQRGGRRERLAGAVDRANSEEYRMSNLVGVVALVLALGLAALLLVRRRASRRP